ncbi:hypothetical protein [Legionella taurinensis]|uniref:Uncharacterized protein n=1 Tax=Legionella taurinensis TaxID=70611 RepID=A0A3A5L5Q5_9GAMM|nr:hypothetical protein [Legionella taurinensis]RJT48203.1 hypothetical protein D6J04_03650 [Legionella taurinensis]RJT69133.1 hypothetical protein D6J03_03565 [Legionella taurinensis]STY25945.1 Uncharacterised protein [Legionella taurinensis]
MRAQRPEDILADAENYACYNNINVRKGTVAAVLRNAEIMASPLSSEAEKQEALAIISELAPGLVALGVHEHLIFKNPDIQQKVDQAAATMRNTPGIMAE